MKKILKIQNLNFTYQDKKVFDNFNLEILENSFTTIMGLSGSGKSTLVKLILGLFPSENSIIIDDMYLNKNNIKEIRKKIGVVFENPDVGIIADTVIDDIAFTLENLKVPSEEIQERIDNIAEILDITDILDKAPNGLSAGEKQKVALASALVIEPKILILDEAFVMLDPITKEKVFKLIQDIKKHKNITIINITHDIEDSIYTDDLIIIDDGKLILKGPKELVYQEEETFKNLGLDLPFMVSLSNKLKYYNLIDKIIYDMEEMVDILWM